jgi:hypothetical protein
MPTRLYNDAIDYSALDWMSKSVWGPIKWKELHAGGLCELPMDHEKQWFKNFVEGLPCPDCRRHFEEFLNGHPPDFATRERFFLWTVKAHNSVNRALGKPELSVEDARELHSWKKED